MLCCHSPTRHRKIGAGRGRLPELETEEPIFLLQILYEEWILRFAQYDNTQTIITSIGKRIHPSLSRRVGNSLRSPPLNEGNFPEVHPRPSDTPASGGQGNVVILTERSDRRTHLSFADNL